MNRWKSLVASVFAVASLVTLAGASELKIDLRRKKPGSAPTTFEPIVGTWVVTQEAGENVIMVDGGPGWRVRTIPPSC